MDKVKSFVKKNKSILLKGGGACALLGGAIFIREKGFGWIHKIEENEPINRQRVYAVTGTTSGIGKQVATDLARKNHKVYMLCRDMARCERLRSQIVTSTRNESVYCRHCDLSSQKSVRKCAQDLRDQETKLDGLLNNAGLMFAPRGLTEDGIETHWAVNHLSHFLLTRLLSPLLKDGGRVVYMMHLDYRKARDGIPLDDINMTKLYDKCVAFSRSQLANLLVAKELAFELEDQGITVNAVYPGTVVGTKIDRYLPPRKSMTEKFQAWTMWYLGWKSLNEAVYDPMYALLDKSMNNVTGMLYTNMHPMEVMPAGNNPELGMKLVAVNDYWLGFKTKAEVSTKKPEKDQILSTSK